MKSVNQSHFENIPTFPAESKDDYAIHAIIETPAARRHKYELDQAFGIFKLKTTIASGLAWPYDYGFVPQTLGDDGDPLDVLFLSEEPTFSGCLVQARLVGIVRLEKNGEENDRLVACAERIDGTAQATDEYENIDDLPKELLKNVVRFLTEYSEELDNAIEYKGVASRKNALAAVKQGIKAFNKHRKKKSRS